MALDLTNEFIALTFQRLLQIDPTEDPTGFKPFSLSDAINSDSATLINGVGKRINGVVIEQFNQAGLFLKNTSDVFQIYSGQDFFGNQGISISKYDPTQIVTPGIFVKDNGDLVVGFPFDQSFSEYSLYVDKGIHIISQNGKSILKGKRFTTSIPYQESSEIRFYAKNEDSREYVSNVSSSSSQTLIATPGNANYPIPGGGGSFDVSGGVNNTGIGYLKLEFPTQYSAGNLLTLEFALFRGTPIPGLFDFSTIEESINVNYIITQADEFSQATLINNFISAFQQQTNLMTMQTPYNDVRISLPNGSSLDYYFIFGPNFPAPPFAGFNNAYFTWQMTGNSQTNSTNANQKIVELDKDIMDSGIFKRKDASNNVKCSMIWRRVGNVIHVTGYRQSIDNSISDPDAVELLPVVPQSHVINGSAVYNSLFGNGVLRDGNNNDPIPIICKANDLMGTIASQNCAVQFFKYNDLSNPIKDVGGGDIRFSFSYDLKN